MKKTAIYCRVANADQLAIDNQKTALNQLAVDKGYSDIVYYIDNGFSGTTLDRPAFNELTNDLSENKIDVLLITDLSRLSRSFPLLDEWFEATQKGDFELLVLETL